MIETVFYAAVIATLFVALQNWRAALYLSVVLDVVRDPVRKLSDDHSIMITQSVSVIWLVVAMVVLLRERRRLATMARRYPALKTAAALLIVALIPGAIVSLSKFDFGWKLALLGAVSYLGFIPGVLIGYAFPSSIGSVRKFMAFYCIVNCIGLTSGLAEYLHWDWPALGGIGVTWIRYRPGFIVPLMCGWYRSPDLLGLHAAVACMFALVLATTSNRPSRFGWYGAAAWTTAAMLLAGRRKMIGIPFVYLAAFAYFTLRRTGKVSQVIRYVAVGACVVGFVFFFSTDLGLSANYSDYASSLWTGETADRGTGVIASSLTTLDQSGFFGVGLGTATQGSQLIVGHGVTWQEDGAGKLFAELGVAGVVLIGCALFLLFRSGGVALRSFPGETMAFRLQAGMMSVVLGNLASFIISHQAYSGDPTSVCLVLFCLGIVFALPEALKGRAGAAARIRFAMQPVNPRPA
jgi:hypothetical protein